MAQWCFVTGMPGIGQTAALENCARQLNVQLEPQHVHLADCTLTNDNTSSTSGRTSYVYRRLTRLWKRALGDPAQVLFDHAPFCTLLYDRARALHNGQMGEMNCLSIKHIVDCAMELLDCLAHSGVKVRLVVNLVRKDSNFAIIAERMSESGAPHMNARLLTGINYAFYEFAGELSLRHKHPNITFRVVMVHVRSFVTLTPDILFD